MALLLCLLVFWLTARPLSSFKRTDARTSFNNLTQTSYSEDEHRPIPFLDRYFALKTILDHKKTLFDYLAHCDLGSLPPAPSQSLQHCDGQELHQYLGAGQADVLIDISQTEDSDTKGCLLKGLQADKDM